MTPKPAPKTVHHPLAISENLLTLRRSRLHRRGSWPTSTTLLASRRSRSSLPATALPATNTLRCSRPSSLPHSAHDFEHLAMSSTMFAAMQLPRCAHLSALTFAILAARPNTFVFVLRRSRSSVPLGGHVSCSSFDDHVMLAFTVPADRVCLSTSALRTALGL
jgi:hypothetical protein